MKIQNFSLFALLAVMLGVMSSCSKKAELLDTIPANVTTVTTLNLRSLCEASGIKFTEEGIKASPEIEKNIAPTIPDVINNLAEMDAKGVADFSTIALVLDKNNTAFMTFAISDFERFKLVMEDAITWNADNDGFLDSPEPQGILRNFLRLDAHHIFQIVTVLVKLNGFADTA